MAVVSISRIQLRRGRKNAGTGLPQLASGELGWAIDAQELYIGNGAVSEGAPFVGNTKILTENENLFDLANNYTYKSDISFISTGVNPSVPVTRSLQQRLDDYVSIKSFGAAGDASDQTAEIQNALFQLFLNDASKNSTTSRVTLHLDPGDYTVSSTIYLPPYTTIAGAGQQKTVINYTGTGPMFRTINSDSLPDLIAEDSTTSTENQSTNLNMSGMTINVSTSETVFFLYSVKNSQFADIEILGNWDINSQVVNTNSAIKLESLSSAVTCKDNVFENITVKNMAYAVYSDYDITSNHFTNCRLETLGKGIIFGESTIQGSLGQQTGPVSNTVKNSRFNDIKEQAIWVNYGYANASENNRYFSVGNNGGNSLTPTYPVIQYDEPGNSTNNDWFERSQDLGYNQNYLFNIPYIPEVDGPVTYQNHYSHKLNVNEQNTFQKFFRLPGNSKKRMIIDYVYSSSAYNITRTGVLEVSVDPVGNFISSSEEFDYAGDENFVENLQFKFETRDEDGDSLVDTVAVMMLNSSLNDIGEFNYTIKTIG